MRASGVGSMIDISALEIQGRQTIYGSTKIGHLKWCLVVMIMALVVR